jgi:hypothetical protein
VKPVRIEEAIILKHTEMAAFNMSEAAAHFGVDPRVIPPRKRAASIGN